jgi:TPR repeat protein
LLEKSAIQGNYFGQYMLGVFYNEGKIVKQDTKKAMEWYLKSANQGYSDAQYQIALMYINEEKYNKYKEWIEKAAFQEHSKAQYALGAMYERGVVGMAEQNILVAKEWFGKACDGGLQIGCDKYKELNIK